MECTWLSVQDTTDHPHTDDQDDEWVDKGWYEYTDEEWAAYNTAWQDAEWYHAQAQGSDYGQAEKGQSKSSVEPYYQNRTWTREDQGK